MASPAAFGQSRLPWVRASAAGPTAVAPADPTAHHSTFAPAEVLVAGPNAGTSRAALPKRQFFAVLGAVRRPGVYSLPVDRPKVGELLVQAGGPTPAATGDLRLVRAARTAVRMFVGAASFAEQAATGSFRGAAAQQLMPNDILVVEPRRPRTSGPKVITVGHTDWDEREDTSPVQLGLLGVIDRPVIVTVLPERANIGTVLKDLGQDPQLARHVRLAPPTRLGIRALPPERSPDPAAVPLVTGDVLILPAKRLQAEALPVLPPPIVVTQWPPVLSADAAGDEVATGRSAAVGERNPPAPASPSSPRRPDRRDSGQRPHPPADRGSQTSDADHTHAPAPTTAPSDVPAVARPERTSRTEAPVARSKTEAAASDRGADRTRPAAPDAAGTATAPPNAATPLFGPFAAPGLDPPKADRVNSGGGHRGASDGHSSGNAIAGAPADSSTGNPRQGEAGTVPHPADSAPSLSEAGTADSPSAPESERPARAGTFFDRSAFPFAEDSESDTPPTVEDASNPVAPRPLGILQDPAVDLQPLPRRGDAPATPESSDHAAPRAAASGSRQAAEEARPAAEGDVAVGAGNAGVRNDAAADAELAGELARTGSPEAAASAAKPWAWIWVILSVLVLVGAGVAARHLGRTAATSGTAGRSFRPHFAPSAVAGPTHFDTDHPGESGTKPAPETSAAHPVQGTGGTADTPPPAGPAPRPLRLEELLHGGVPIVGVAPELPRVTQLAGRRQTTEPRRFDRPHRVRRPHTAPAAAAHESERPETTVPNERQQISAADAATEPPLPANRGSAVVLDIPLPDRREQLPNDRPPSAEADPAPKTDDAKIAPMAAPHFLRSPVYERRRRRTRAQTDEA